MPALMWHGACRGLPVMPQGASGFVQFHGRAPAGRLFVVSMPVAAALPDLASPLPRVSVILPVYNHAAYVIEALDSVRAQTLGDWELIVIDDGSTDDSRAVLQRYVEAARDPRIQLYLQDNAGSHAAINRGLSLARAPYLAILNSDDRFAPTRLERLLALAQQHPGDLLAVTAVRLIDGEGALVEERDPQFWWLRMYRDILDYWRASQRNSAHPARDALLWGNFTISTSNFFLSRTLLDRLGPLGHFRYVLDWEYALRVTIECPQAFHFLDDEPLLDYRLHGRNTILSGAIRNHVEAAWMLRRANKRIARRGEPVPGHAVERLRYLDRFVRQQQVRQLDSQLHQKREKLQATEAHVQKMEWRIQVAEERAASLERLRDEHERLRDEHEQLVRKLALTEAHVGKLDDLLAVRDRELAQGRQALQTAQDQIEQLQRQITGLYASTSWRLTAPVRKLGSLVQRVRRPAGLQPGPQAAAPVPSVPVAPRSEHCSEAYARWLQDEGPQLQAWQARAAETLNTWAQPPRVAVLVHTDAVQPDQLERTLASVRGQHYPHWRLLVCLSGAAVSSPLAARLPADERIAAQAGDASTAWHEVAHVADCSHVIWLEAGNALAEEALWRLADVLVDRPHASLVYTDEDHLDAQGLRCEPRFKPDWSPALLWTHDYLGGLLCARRDLLPAGPLVPGHALALSLVERGAMGHHLPQVLHHRRLGSEPGADPQALGSFLQRRYGEAFLRVDPGARPGLCEPRFRLPAQARASIIIPTKDKVELLQPCIDSILEHAGAVSLEIIILDNNSVEARTAEYLRDITARDGRVRAVAAPIPFNWSRLNNIGVQHASGDVLVFLNNDTLVITPDWLERLMEVALLPDVATVGPLLLYEDGTVQHAGVVVGMGGWADHVYKAQLPDVQPGVYVPNAVMRNVMASTGACVAIARDTFEAIGGFDEAFEICGSDVELGVRAHKRGLQNVYLPTVRLYHLESKTRSPHVPEVDFIQSDLKYAPYRLGGDPFFNPNLDPMGSTPTPLHPRIAG